MQHFTFDGTAGSRTRLDDQALIFALCERLPAAVGLAVSAPPVVLPYYDGVEPDDCGISAFVFLPGGHLTIHTFSVRESYFIDAVSPTPFDFRELERQIRLALPCGRDDSSVRTRGPGGPNTTPAVEDRARDFGPHVFVDMEGYRAPSTLDVLFSLFDRLPGDIGMTPIMRPHLTEGTGPDGQPVISAMTMIAESHISLHVFPEERRAYLDLFSCRFFESAQVLPKVLAAFDFETATHSVEARGRAFRIPRSEPKIHRPATEP